MLTISYSQITILLKKILIGIDKLNSRHLHFLLVYTHRYTPTSQKYFNELLITDSVDWKRINLLPCLVTLDLIQPLSLGGGGRGGEGRIKMGE